MFQETVALETPEHVAVEFEVAGPMSRYAAALLDGMWLFVSLVVLVLLVLAGLAITGAVGRGGDAFLGAAFIAAAVLSFGYFPLFERFMHGQTPGKRTMGIRVMRRDMAPLDFTSVFIRAILRIVDVLPGLPFPLVGMVCMSVSPQGLRLGDLAAGTWVVRDQADPASAASRAKVRAAAARKGGDSPAAEGVGRLTAAEYRLAVAFLDRAPTLDDALRRAAAVRVSSPIARRLGESWPDPEAFLREEVEKGGAGRSLV